MRIHVLLIGALMTLGAATPARAAERISVDVPVGEYEIRQTPQGADVAVEGYGSLLVAGAPKLPSRIFAIAVPPGAEVVAVTCDAAGDVVLPGRYDVRSAPLPRVIGDEDPALAAERLRASKRTHDAVYGSDDAYPPQIARIERRAGYRRYDLVDVRVTPFTYRARSRRLVYHPQITVHIDYEMPDRRVAAVDDALPRTEATARRIILNYDAAAAWYPPARSTLRGLHDFVIITLDSLTPSVVPLVDWETAKGRTVEVVTTSWIDANYGGVDLAEKMRNFLRERYPSDQWGIEDVLLVGHYDDVPMRRTAQNLGYGAPETDYYYADLSLPDDQSWDADGDQQWGEDTDPIDFYAEINVGRIPWSNPATVASICQKSVAYEQNGDPAYKKNILLLGAFFWDNDPNPQTDNAILMEAKVDQPWMWDWTMTRMYEENADCQSPYACDYELLHANVMSVWPSGQFAFVNWAGHGSPTSSHIYGLGMPAFITSSDCPSLSDNYPAIIFADACSNSDTDELNIGQAMMQHGAVGFVGATKVAMGCPGWTGLYDGSSQSLDYLFTTYVTSGDYTQGQAHQQALTDMYSYGLWDALYYEMFEWGALWGNPDLGLTATAALSVTLPQGPPAHLEPGAPTEIAVRITDGVDEAYLAGSGRLHYRYDGGAYQTSTLVPAGGENYVVTLPPCTCAAAPEFYVSIQGDAGSTVTSPPDAPGAVYTASVGTEVTLMHDTFQTDLGWTAENLGATAGDWERGVPVNDPDWAYDPLSDSDGSGQCYLTQNEMGNSDIDNGAVRLTSPVFDMSGGQSIAYDYFFNLNNNEGNDLLLVEASNGGPAGWQLVTGYYTSGSLSWRHDVITEADLIAAGVPPTATMSVRFTANDADTQSIVEAGIDAFVVTGLECENPCPADFNGDRVVTVSDFLQLLADWGTGGADIDGDGTTGVTDFLALLAAWGPCP